MTYDPIARARAMLADWRDERGVCWGKLSPERLLALAEDLESLNDAELEEFDGQWTETFGFSLFVPSGRAPSRTTDASANDDDAMLSRAQVTRMVGVSVSTLKRMEADGRFPPPIQITERRVGWPLRVVRDWLDNRPRKRVA